jgi:hypothetical protein
MGERTGGLLGFGMRVTMIFAVLLGAVALAPLPVMAEPKMGAAKPGATSSDVSSQSQRPRIRVQRGGRLLYRDCNFRLAQQMRPSGPVIVPVQYCWWVRG